MSFKKIVHQIHLWPGLITGLPVFIIAITGCIYAFQEEIQELTQAYRHVEKTEQSVMLPSELGQIAEEALPGKSMHGIKYQTTGKSAEAIFYNFDPTYYYIVYLNPHSGEVLKVKDMQKDFFRWIITGHYYLWLPPHIGQPVVAWSTLIFALVVLSGLIIWIPKSRKAFRNRIWFHWKKKPGFKRFNFDMHVVVGFYATIFALIFAITGLVWGFQWFARSYYQLAGGEKSLAYSEANPNYIVGQGASTLTDPIDKVFLFMQENYPEAYSIEVHPHHDDTSLLMSHAQLAKGKQWKTDYRYFDPHTLDEVSLDNIYGRIEDADFADKLMRMNYDIHTGAILGLPGKIFAFLMSLLIASLPITGFFIWLKKKKKKKKH